MTLGYSEQIKNEFFISTNGGKIVLLYYISTESFYDDPNCVHKPFFTSFFISYCHGPKKKTQHFISNGNRVTSVLFLDVYSEAENRN